ncbi:MAG: uroporphyrinogen-III synthase [Streptosporangiales bacterium]|nr:uroporphyrinogen-III synthase [Streptosporangiales bacterium]
MTRTPPSTGAPPGAGTPLAGYTVGVTAARRRDELAALLERRGARVVQGPAIRLVPLADDARLHAATDACLRGPIDDVVVTTGIGFRAWIETADGWGLGPRLLRRLATARILARGPKARGALRAAGLREAWSPDSEACAELQEHLITGGVAGRRIAVQLHGEQHPELPAALRAAGAEVIEVPVYRWAPPADTGPLDRLIRRAVTGTLDSLVFTSAPAVEGTLRAAAAAGLRDRLLDTMRGDVVACCVGPVTAAPLLRHGIAPLQPERGRLGALVRTLCAELPPRRGRHLLVSGHTVELRGHAVLVDGLLRTPAPAPMTVLRALARRPGHVVSRAALRDTLSADADEHAVEMAVNRLRRALGAPGLVRTVVKRGYRLACEPVREQAS